MALNHKFQKQMSYANGILCPESSFPDRHHFFSDQCERLILLYNLIKNMKSMKNYLSEQTKHAILMKTRLSDQSHAA
jgi:hypothetical protein